eukprot:Selendium_serpulae@DN6481_c0_g2_i1.p1
MALVAPEDAVKIGAQFVQHYYTTFASNREGLAGLYSDDSMMTYEDANCKGQRDIITKLKDLKFQKVQHVPIKCDYQPSPNSGVLVFVTGDVSIDDGAPMKFSQVFNLQPNQGGYYSKCVL